jgi:hypothetical protein
MILDNFQHPRPSKALQRLGIDILAAGLRQTERESEGPLDLVRTIEQVFVRPIQNNGFC